MCITIIPAVKFKLIDISAMSFKPRSPANLFHKNHHHHQLHLNPHSCIPLTWLNEQNPYKTKQNPYKTKQNPYKTKQNANHHHDYRKILLKVHISGCLMTINYHHCHLLAYSLVFFQGYDTFYYHKQSIYLHIIFTTNNVNTDRFSYLL